MGVIRHLLRWHLQPAKSELQKIVGVVRQMLKMRGEGRLAHQNGNTAIALGDFQPVAVQPPVFAQRAVMLKMRGAKLADLLGDFIAPGDLVLAVASAVQQITDVVPVGHGRFVLQRRQQLQFRNTAIALGQRLAQGRRIYSAVLPRLLVVTGRHQAVHLSQRRNLRGDLRELLAAHFPPGVNRNHAVQRPSGGDA